jgi:hypothetical protein
LLAMNGGLIKQSVKKKGESLLAGGSSNDQVSTAILPHVVCVPSV